MDIRSTIDLGARVRKLRQERHMSLRALARASGLSANALSMIERNKVSPSVSTLYKLADALEVPITAFFREEPQRKPIVFRKAADRTRIPFTRGCWEGLGGEFFIGRVEPFMLTLEPGGNSGRHAMVHSGHEFVICLEGLLEYTVEDQKYLLQPGDSLLFAAHLKHTWRNVSNEVTRAMFVLSGFQAYERPGEFHLHASGMPTEPQTDTIDSSEPPSSEPQGGNPS